MTRDGEENGDVESGVSKGEWDGRGMELGRRVNLLRNKNCKLEGGGGKWMGEGEKRAFCFQGRGGRDSWSG